MKIITAVIGTGCVVTGLLAGPVATAGTQCPGTQTTLPDGTTVCAPAEQTAPLLPTLPDDLADVVSPGSEGAGATQCSPGAVVTVLGTAYTCPPAPVQPPASVTVVPRSPVLVTPPTAGQQTVDSDLVVTH